MLSRSGDLRFLHRTDDSAQEATKHQLVNCPEPVPVDQAQKTDGVEQRRLPD
jgi:hypothetical protein